MSEFPTFFNSIDTSFFSADWLIFAFALLVLGVFILYSLFLVYHALRYGAGFFLVYVMLGVYFVVSLSLIGSMLTTTFVLT